MITPTAADVRAVSKLDYGDLGYAEGETPDTLQSFVDQANGYVFTVTARPLDATMPVALAPMALAAAVMRVEQLVQREKPDNVETAVEGELVSSFTAGPYSETRRDNVALSNGAQALNAWPALNDALWMLLTLLPGETNDLVAERLDYWRWRLGMAPNLPAWELVEVDWAGQWSGSVRPTWLQ